MHKNGIVISKEIKGVVKEIKTVQVTLEAKILGDVMVPYMQRLKGSELMDESKRIEATKKV